MKIIMKKDGCGQLQVSPPLPFSGQWFKANCYVLVLSGRSFCLPTLEKAPAALRPGGGEPPWQPPPFSLSPQCMCVCVSVSVSVSALKALCVLFYPSDGPKCFVGSIQYV